MKKTIESFHNLSPESKCNCFFALAFLFFTVIDFFSGYYITGALELLFAVLSGSNMIEELKENK